MKFFQQSLLFYFKYLKYRSALFTKTMSQNSRVTQDNILPNLSLETRFQRAREALEHVEVKNKKEAAALVPMNPTTFNHHFSGRKLAEQTWTEMQALSPLEEDLLLSRCALLSRCGFPPCIWKVHDIAVEVGCERDPHFTLSERWMDKSGFYKRHPEARRGYCHPIDAVRAERGSDLGILLGFFKQVRLKLFFMHCFNIFTISQLKVVEKSTEREK